MVKLDKLAKRYRIDDGDGFRLKDWDPADTNGLDDKDAAQEALVQSVAKLAEMQDMLYAQDHWSVLLIFQAMDAAGKDSTIKHVMSGVNPQGCQVTAFKQPSAQELDHDFMWRTTANLPERGRIGIFNRSYYEEVLVVRVHPEILANQRLPPKLVTKKIWKERYEDINAFERYLARNGTLVLKFFLNVSKEEQKKRFLARLDEPEKHWKFQPSDVAERQHWDAYMKAYEEMIRATATPQGPWHVIPADSKWFTRLAVASAVVEAMQGLDLHYPKVDPKLGDKLNAARTALENE
ncbi:PPK2 family polyphosphate:nucleotide phosphotransferase [Inquilinus ginsengisoli]|uniref:PPK2 family polyphosphate:nucleotide phosphotransferase n=1 Tax=Inquilinus ginsengisoli TaxID=363840 RepID=A0ABU1JTP1_9PROT|nr:polyphosphate kinase 2 family protein [Inquilinus ginsengisoli]MDR6290955.1 PPK2 family polyphosphate:nucleotide phosphotransferase [Inquilinus ginsengisoli]